MRTTTRPDSGSRPTRERSRLDDVAPRRRPPLPAAEPHRDARRATAARHGVVALVVLIPAYQPDMRLTRLVRDVRRALPETRVLVVDDGSGPAYEGVFAAARAAGAEFVLTYIHWGVDAEYKTEPSASMRRMAQELADAARSMWEDVTATPETARTRHSQPAPPAYASEEGYEPAFALCFPLPGQHDRRTSGYGWRTDPMGGLEEDFHIGNDLAAPEGTAVLAAADGIVRMAGRHKSYGNYLRVLHADGDETLYAHLQYLFVRAGEAVSAGQTLGTVGQTGNATGPHLHFEILHRGLRYDPAAALQHAS